MEAGVEIFWTTYIRRLAAIAGITPTVPTTTTVFETYPRYVIKQLWPDLLHIPSKRKAPLDYVDALWGRIQAAGYTCAGVMRPAVDHVDAMLCALTAEAQLKRGGSLDGAAGKPPIVDTEEMVVREGYIIGP